MPQLPRFSILVPNYNHGKQIGEALDALLGQSVQPRAIHIVDDGSTDDSRDVIARYVSLHPHVHATYLSKNQGVIQTMNDWLLSVDDTYVYFASADDIVMPGFFEKSLALLADYPEAALVSSLTLMVDANGVAMAEPNSPRPLNGSGYLSPAAVAKQLYAVDSWINGNTVIYNREALVAVGGFPLALEGFTDGFVFRLLALMKGACFIEEPLAKWRWEAAGYANCTIYAADMALQVATNATRLMRETYADIFPAGYAQRWRQRWLFASVIGQLNLPNEQAYQAICQLLAPMGALEKFMVKAILSMPVSRLKKLLAQLYFSVTLRPYDLFQASHRHIFAKWGRKLS